MTATPVAARDISLARIVALGLAEPVGDALAVARHLGSMQAQDLPGALVSSALRTPQRSVAEVVRAFDDGLLVRNWTQRETLQVVPATDQAWMLQLTAPRMRSGAAKRLRTLGIDDELERRSRGVALQLLDGQPAVTRAELFDAWDGAGLVQGVAQRAVHLLSLACRDQVLALGPMRPTRTGVEQLVVPAESWIPRPERLDEDEALRRWADAFFTSHGPATETDFARWTGLTLTLTRRAIAANPQLARFQLDGETMLMAPDLPDRLATHREAARATMLLPGFDELVLGYKDRSRTVPAAHADAICPGNNGMFRATIVHDGQVVATWRKGTATKQQPVPAPLVSWLDEASDELVAAASNAAERHPR